MRLRYNKKEKFQYGGVVGGGFYQMPLPFEIPDTYTGAGSLTADPNLIFAPKEPKINKEALKPDLTEFFKDLKGKGHTNEVNQIQYIKNQLDNQLSNLSDLDILSGTDKFKKVLNGYASLTSPAMVNQLINSKNRTDDSFKIATSKKNLSQMHVKDGKIKVINQNGEVVDMLPNEAIKLYREGKVIIPTNAKLWQERDTNPKLAHDYNLSQELTYGLNIDDVIDKWRKNFTSLGNTEYGSRYKNAIDIVSKEIAAGNTVFAQDIMKESKNKSNYAQVKAALDMSMSAMSQEEIDTLYGFAYGRLISLGLDVTPENLKTQMYSALINLAESKKDYSDWSASEVGKVEMTDIGKNVIGAGSQKYEKIGFFENAILGHGNQVMFTVGEGQYKMNIIGTDLGDIINIGGKGAQYKLLSESPVLNEPGAPLIASNIGYTFNNIKVKSDEVIPIGRPAVVLVAVDKETNKIIGTEESLKKAKQFDPTRHEIRRMIMMKVVGINKDKPGWFTGGELDEEVEKGYAQPVLDKKLKDTFAGILNMQRKVEGKEDPQNTRNIYDEGSDELIEFTALFPASSRTVARNKDKNEQLIPQQEARLKEQVEDQLNYNKQSETKVESINPVE